MKITFPPLLAVMFFVPAMAIAAPGNHDFSKQFKACYAAAKTSNEAKSSCLSDELDRQSKAVADLHDASAQSLADTDKQQLADDFAEWKKAILLDCSILADGKTVPIERENARKYCLIERTIGRLNSYELIRQDKTLVK
ncbi:hypothetical protein [Paraherbaspirillum soli]|uniref:Lysozyme inhibitor LprI N-terminal domain-containing protein n=1 Tax=Paraherbaspirillum soli TaxID=631222 RepID=A0ABW0MBC8_9BURK